MTLPVSHRQRSVPRRRTTITRGLRGTALVLGCCHLFLSGAWFAAGFPLAGAGSILLAVGIPALIMLADR